MEIIIDLKQSSRLNILLYHIVVIHSNTQLCIYFLANYVAFVGSLIKPQTSIFVEKLNYLEQWNVPMRARGKRTPEMAICTAQCL